ncbi:MAG: tetratricopeptide repeat protein [Planctomycetota bacterium]
MRRIALVLLVLGATVPAQEDTERLRHAEQLRRAERLFRSGSHAEAARILEPVLAAGGGDAEAHALLGHCYFELGRLERARVELTRAVGEGRLTSDVVIRLARISSEQGAPAAALNALRLAHLLTPRNAAVLSAAGEAAARAGLREEAASAFRAAVDLDPARPGAYLRLGNACLAADDSAGALAAFETAHHLGAGSPELARMIADLHARRGELVRAAGWYERMLLSEPEDGAGHRLRCAQLLAAAGDVERAREHAARAAASTDPTVAGGAHLLLGRLAGRAGDMRAAVDHWRRALALGQGGADVHGALGAHFHRAGRHAEAVKHLRERLRRGPPDPALWHALVRSLLALGERKAARAELVRLVAEFGLDDKADRLVTDLVRAGAKAER